MPTLGIAFNKQLPQKDSFVMMAEKKPVYDEFVSLCRKKGFETYLVSTKKYLGKGVFEIEGREIKFDIIYDRSGGTNFPIENDNLRVVDNRDFKLLAWDKWEAYKTIGSFMPKTVLAKDFADIPSDIVVLKPARGLKGLGIFIGSKKNAESFKIPEGKKYVAQEFIDTSSGIPGIVEGNHDLRIVIINKKIVWSHVRTPPKGSLTANVAKGGTLKEVLLEDIPTDIKNIAITVAEKFASEYDNPLFSLDFGVDEKGRPYIFEINDQIGFPKPDMINKDNFLTELVENIVSKL